jgi:hypothetical protein
MGIYTDMRSRGASFDAGLWRHYSAPAIATGSDLSLTPMSAVPHVRQVRDVLLSFALIGPLEPGVSLMAKPLMLHRCDEVTASDPEADAVALGEELMPVALSDDRCGWKKGIPGFAHL